MKFYKYKLLNAYPPYNSCPIRDAMLSYVETSRRLEHWNLMNENT